MLWTGDSCGESIRRLGANYNPYRTEIFLHKENSPLFRVNTLVNTGTCGQGWQAPSHSSHRLERTTLFSAGTSLVLLRANNDNMARALWEHQRRLPASVSAAPTTLCMVSPHFLLVWLTLETIYRAAGLHVGMRRELSSGL